MKHLQKVSVLKSLEKFTAFQGRSVRFKVVALIAVTLSFTIIAVGIYQLLYPSHPEPEVAYSSVIIPPR